MNDKEVKSAVDTIRKKYGKDAIRKFDEASIVDIPTISTGSISLDLATGIGGIPLGRIVEVFGPESHGKTTVALHFVAEAQKVGKKCCFVDAEHALDPRYAKQIGVDIDELYISQPDSAEDALGVVSTSCEKGGFSIIVIDSVAALVPLAELEGDMDQQQVALQARLMSKALRKIKGSASKSQTAVVFINQVREKVGVIWGRGEVTPGGRALKFYASLRFDVRRRRSVKETDGAVKRISAIDCEVKVVKNKLSSPFMIGEIRINFGKGMDKSFDLFKVASKLSYIKKSGNTYKVRTGKKSFTKVVGKAKTMQYLADNPKLMKMLEEKIKSSLL